MYTYSVYNWKYIVSSILILTVMASIQPIMVDDEPAQTYDMAVSLPVGEGKGKISYHSGIEEMEERGPESFAVGDGNIYVLDTLSSEIEIFSMNGIYVKTIPLPKNKEFSDIEIDEDGNLYALNDLGKIYKFKKNSDSVDEIIKYDASKKIVNMIGLRRSLESGVELLFQDGTVLNVSGQSELGLDHYVGESVENDIVLTSDHKTIRVEYEFMPAGTYPLVEDAQGITYVLENEMLLGREAYMETRVGQYDAEGRWIGTALALETKYEYAAKVPNQFIYVTQDGRAFQMILRERSVDIIELSFSKEKKTNITQELMDTIL